MEWSCATEGDQREISWVQALLDCTRANSVRHVGVDNGQDAGGRILKRHVQGVSQCSDHTLRCLYIKEHGSTEEIVWLEVAQHHMGIRDRGLLAPLTISRRPRLRTSTVRPNAEGSAGVDMRNGAATSANGVNVDHGGHNWVAPDPGVTRRSLGEGTVHNQTDIG